MCFILQLILLYSINLLIASYDRVCLFHGYCIIKTCFFNEIRLYQNKW